VSGVLKDAVLGRARAYARDWGGETIPIALHSRKALPCVMSATETCVGCGATVPAIPGPVHRYMTSAPGCWAMFGEVSARIRGLQDAVALQNAVDAFAVQHRGNDTPQAAQSVVGHLVLLYARLELGLPLDRAFAALKRVIAVKGAYPSLPAPPFPLTVRHVYTAPDDPSLVMRAREWAESAWKAWTPQRDQVIKWFDNHGRA